MNSIPMYALFVESCVMILLVLRKKHMTVACAVFGAIGLYVGAVSLFFLLMGTKIPVMAATYMLFISGSIFNIATVTIVIATIYSLVYAAKRLAEYFVNKHYVSHKPMELCLDKKLLRQNITHKYFILFCRWIN